MKKVKVFKAVEVAVRCMWKKWEITSDSLGVRLNPEHAQHADKNKTFGWEGILCPAPVSIL